MSNDGGDVAGAALAGQPGGTPARPPRRVRAVLIGAAAVLVAVAAVVVLTAAGKPAHPRHGAAGHVLKQAPAFSLPELGHASHHIALAAYAGKPVIVNFFASWCGPCKQETPLLASFYAAHHGQVLIIGVDSNDETPAALKFVHAEGVTYPVAFDAYPALTAVSYGIVALPQTYLLNAKHQIVRHISGDVTKAELTAWAASLSRSAAGS